MLNTAAFRRTAASGFAPMVRGVAWILACVPIALAAAPDALPKADDLARDAALMRADNMPMVVLYSQANCSYCEQARRYLGPMAHDPAMSQRALFRQIDIDSDATLTDFGGRPGTHRSLSRAQKAQFTPTVVVLDADGRTLGEPIIGMRLADFYGQYIENAIDDARRALGAPD